MKNLFKIGLCIRSLSLAAGAWAKDDHIILQEAAKNHVSVSAISKLKDETAVTLKGTLLKHLNETTTSSAMVQGLFCWILMTIYGKHPILKQAIKCSLWARWIHIVINRPILKSLK